MSSILQDETKTAILAYMLIKKKYFDARNFSQTDTGLIRMCGSSKLNKLWVELINVARDRLLHRKDLLNLFYIQYYKEWPAMVYRFFQSTKNVECTGIWCYLLLEPHQNDTGVYEVAETLNASVQIVQFYTWKQSLDNATLSDADRQVAFQSMRSLLIAPKPAKLLEYEQSALDAMPPHLSLFEYLQLACYVMYVDKFFIDFYDQQINWFEVPLIAGVPQRPPGASGLTGLVRLPRGTSLSAGATGVAPAATPGGAASVSTTTRPLTTRTTAILHAARALRDTGIQAARGVYSGGAYVAGGLGWAGSSIAGAVRRLGTGLLSGTVDASDDEFDVVEDTHEAAEEVLDEAVAMFDSQAAYDGLWAPPPRLSRLSRRRRLRFLPPVLDASPEFPSFPSDDTSSVASGPALPPRRPPPSARLSWMATGHRPAGRGGQYRRPPPPRSPSSSESLLDPEAMHVIGAGSPRAEGLLPRAVPTEVLDPDRLAVPAMPHPRHPDAVVAKEPFSLEATPDNISRHVEDSPDVSISEVVLDVVNSEAEIDPSLQGEPHQPHGFGGESDILELGICESHALELPGSGFQSNDVSEIPVKIMDGVGGPIHEVDGVPSLATCMEHPHANVGLHALEFFGGDIPLQDPVEIDKLIVFNISPVQSSLQLVSPAMDAGALSGCESNKHCVEEKNLYDPPPISLRNQCIHDGVYSLKTTHRMDACLEKL